MKSDLERAMGVQAVHRAKRGNLNVPDAPLKYAVPHTSRLPRRSASRNDRARIYTTH